MRPRTLPASIAPVLVGAASAWSVLSGGGQHCVSTDDGVWMDMEMGKGPCAMPWYAYGDALPRFAGMTLLCMGVALFLQIAVNFANDYSDGVRGTDESRGVHESVSGKPQRLTASGLVAPGRVLAAAGVAAALACVCGLAVAVLSRQYWFVGVGLLCLAAGWWYTGGRHPYGYAGLGEASVFVFFGLVATLGTQLAVVQAFDGFGMPGAWRIDVSSPFDVSAWSGGWYWRGAAGLDWFGFLAAVCVGLDAVALLMVNNLRDIDDDRVHGKRTLAVRLGERGARAALVACEAAQWLTSAFLYLWLCLASADWVSYAATGHIGRMDWAALPLLLAAAAPGLAMAVRVPSRVARGRFGAALKTAGLQALWFAVAFAALSFMTAAAPDPSISGVV
ncbi:1,4-dihydroxy-2-naphthoate octaprenyltransferase [Bifidobacterium platyrrhinorum]|nr:1,4-dihydroxy-2-naphthoate octaprenyltransferase [Bifidobacterium platyrrhinorum]